MTTATAPAPRAGSGKPPVTLTVTLDNKTFPITLEYDRNAQGQWKFFASVTAHGQVSERIEVGDDPEVTIWDAARLWNLVSPKDKIEIPGLCHRPELGYQAVGVCRLCSVSVCEEGRPGKTYAAACMRQCKDGMVVLADDRVHDADEKLQKARERLRDARKTLVELLLAEHPTPCAKEREEPGSCELEAYGRRYGLLKATYDLPLDNAKALADVMKNEAELRRRTWEKPTAFRPREREYIPPPDNSNFSIAIDHSACILCDRCVRACSHPEVNNRVIGRTGKGALTRIGFDNDLPMKQSSCVNCGWCMVSCPTGAITYSGANRPKELPWPGAITLPAEYIKELDIVKDGKLSLEFLRRSEGGVVVKQFKKGDVICRQGEYGRTAFYINSGKVNVFINMPQKQATAKGGLLARLFGGGTPAANENPERTKPIPIDPGVTLDPNKPVATLGEGTLFGEEAALNNQARSATVEVAEDGTEIVIMFRNFLDILTRNRTFRAKLEEKFRRWAVDNHLRSSPYFKGAPPELLAQIRDRCTIVRYKPGDVIFNEGDAADAFYMIRLGHVRVTQTATEDGTFAVGTGAVGQRALLRYMMPGEVFGEIGVLFGVPRTASCEALDNVQLVRLGIEDFRDMVARLPEAGKRLEQQARELIENDGGEILRDRATGKYSIVFKNARRAKGPSVSYGVRSRERRTVSLQEYLDQQIYQAQHMLVLDLHKCTRCDECVTACGQSHVGITRLLDKHGNAKDALKPTTRLIRDGLRYDNFLVTTSCRSCRDPKCLIGCPVDAIHRKASLPIVIENHCVGCGKCAENCPFGNITLHPVPVTNSRTGEVQEGRQAAVCNLDNCIEEDRDPSCVYACPHDAAHRVDGQAFFGVDVLGPKEVAELPV